MPARVELSLTFLGKESQRLPGERRSQRSKQLCRVAGKLLDMGTEHPDFGTHLVGSGTPNAYGLYDMVGNVTEHCTDMYADYSYGSITDPFTPWASGQFPMLRGGHWEMI